MWDDVMEGVPSTSSGPCQNKTQNRLLQGTNERMCYLSFIEKEVNEIEQAQNLSQCDKVDSEMSESDSDNPSIPSPVKCKGVRIDRQQKYSRKPVAGWNTYVCLDDYLNKLAWYSKPNETNDQWELFEKSKQTQQHESEPTLSLHEYYGSNYEYYDEWEEEIGLPQPRMTHIILKWSSYMMSRDLRETHLMLLIISMSNMEPVSGLVDLR
jgi:hypothetical protein